MEQIKIKFPETFLREDGVPDELANYIHFRSKTRRQPNPGEKVYDMPGHLEYGAHKGIQPKIDNFRGACLSICMMFLHSKLLNPDVPSTILAQRIKENGKMFLNRYMKYMSPELLK